MKPSTVATSPTLPTEVATTQLATIATLSEQFLAQHHPTGSATAAHLPLTGEFALHRQQTQPDLYGMIDAAYILYTLGRLPALTTPASRQQWASRILACQDQTGWFTKQNHRGHSREHATAYAIGALHLLAVEPDENYVNHLHPLPDLLPLLTNTHQREKWLTHLQFNYTPQDVLRKNVGWHHIWRGSHIGGGIAAILGMTRPLWAEWYPAQATNLNHWFAWYFDWLDTHANPHSGMWQRAFWNLLIRRPTLIDMGGAVHFYWIYEAFQRPFPYPEPVIPATINLQRPDGLYKSHPFCIDLDANYTIIRAYLQLPPTPQTQWETAVHQAISRNFEGVIQALLTRPFTEIYQDSHGLPGALAALAECAKLPHFPYAEALAGWQHPLDKVMWL